MRFEKIPADTIRQTLDYAEQICGSRDFHLFHGIEDRRVDFRMVAVRLLDLGAPIADWRFDPRVFDVRLPGNLTKAPAKDMFGNRRGDWAGDVYVGPEAETLRGIRGEYHARLTNWLFADKRPVPFGSDEERVCAFLIQHMPSVEEFIDEGFPITASERAAA